MKHSFKRKIALLVTLVMILSSAGFVSDILTVRATAINMHSSMALVTASTTTPSAFTSVTFTLAPQTAINNPDIRLAVWRYIGNDTWLPVFSGEQVPVGSILYIDTFFNQDTHGMWRLLEGSTITDTWFDDDKVITRLIVNFEANLIFHVLVRLPAPQNVRIEGNYLRWEAVQGALGYRIVTGWWHNNTYNRHVFYDFDNPLTVTSLSLTNLPAGFRASTQRWITLETIAKDGYEFMGTPVTLDNPVIPPLPAPSHPPDTGNDSNGDTGGGATPAPAPSPSPSPAPLAVQAETIIIGDYEISAVIDGEEISVALTADEIENLIDAVLDAIFNAMQAGEAYEPTVVLDFTSDAFDGATSVALPGELWEAVGDANLGLTLNLPAGAMYFAPSAVANIGSQAGAEVVASISNVDAAEALSPVQQAAVTATGDNALVMQITLTVDGEYVTNLGGMLEVTVPHEGLFPAAVWRITAEGTLELLNANYNAQAGTVTFLTNRLSFFVIGEAPQMVAMVHLLPAVQRVQLTIGSALFTVNGANRTMDVAPFIAAGDRTMVPLRFVAEALGAHVQWLESEAIARVELDGTVLRIPVEELLPGMDVPAVKQNDRILVPLRFVTEAFGAAVSICADNRVINITR
ncbi:MAG: copper amine oxidase N-terminal domain-containing protein [Defluviitaleaceae bacterium]|nr:copper amine oxidase N-terminal domain-containing protein [Defluviitaleaceae bacterium]MCL2274472.1 copper amine oxidase N-terminal domain-containing protein [Defluviitaleaceae bacterium]